MKLAKLPDVIFGCEVVSELIQRSFEVVVGKAAVRAKHFVAFAGEFRDRNRIAVINTGNLFFEYFNLEVDDVQTLFVAHIFLESFLTKTHFWNRIYGTTTSCEYGLRSKTSSLA